MDLDPPPPTLRIQTNNPGTNTTQNFNSGVGSIRNTRGVGAQSQGTTPPRTKSPPLPLIPLHSANSSASNSPAHSSNGGSMTQPHLSPDIVSAGKGGSRGGSRADKSTSSSDSELEEPEARIPRFQGFDDDDDDFGSEGEDGNNSSCSEGLEAEIFDEETKKRLDWTVPDLALLYKILVLNGKRPVGMNKHFTMMSVRSRFSSESKKTIGSEAIWKHLKSLYDLKELEEEDNPDDSPWLANHEFILPDGFSILAKQFSTTAGNAATTPTSKTQHPPKRTTSFLEDEEVDLDSGLGASVSTPKSSASNVTKKTKA